ncbi:MAG: PadR family transcriptional regulator [Saprospiraceae bacterium]|nr:PadR family transcriptional regulator [Lewinella sp.]
MSLPSLGEFEELILLIVAVLHDEAYGVTIFDEIEARRGRSASISAIHMSLKRLEEKGFLESRFGGITQDRGGRRKKFYTITALGKKVLDEQYKLRTNLYRDIPKISFE